MLTLCIIKDLQALEHGFVQVLWVFIKIIPVPRSSRLSVRFGEYGNRLADTKLMQYINKISTADPLVADEESFAYGELVLLNGPSAAEPLT